MRTSREGLARCPLEVMRPISQDFCARARVLKKRAAQSHLSMRTVVRVESICLFSYILVLQGTLHDRQAQPFPEFDTCFWEKAYLLKSQGRM